MVQSIFDDEDEKVEPSRAKPQPRTIYYPSDDDPFGFGDIAPEVAPQPEPAPSTSTQAIFEEPPPVARLELPPPTQLDGQQRAQPIFEDRNVYDDDWYRPDLEAENIRRSGLAWSAGVVFFGSVAFMLFIGWGADLLFGSSPWGLVLGIVLGSVIGFVQFFRISSQIYNPKKNGPDISPLMSSKPEEEDRDPWV